MDTSKQTVLVVDDTPENIALLGEVLKPHYKIKAALNGAKALKIAFSDTPPDIILLDIMMPEMDGYDVCRALKSNPLTVNIPVIFITSKVEVEDERKGFEVGGADYITKPISAPIVEARVRTHLSLYDQSRTLEGKVKQRTEELEETRREIIRRLGLAAEFKDNETGLHVIRMSHYSRLIAEAYSDDRQWTDLVFNAAPMHDIGKIGIPDSVLLKPGKLDKDEWKIMQTHSAIGAQILGEHTNSLLEMAREIAISHHEKWDGSGYPNGKKATEIPISARIVAIADVFDALTSERPYKKAWAVEDAVKLINDEAGTHFDPDLVVLFNSVLPEMIRIRDSYLESDG